MSLRVVLLTRSSRPSGAQMAWRLFESGMAPLAVIVEKRSRMIAKKKEPVISLLLKMGIGFLWRRIWEAVRIRSHFYMRKILGERFKDPVYLSIEELALSFPLKLLEVDDHNSSETRELLRRLDPDIGILTNTRRIKKEVLEIPRHGFFNLHLSALPQYAGLDSIFWALYHGEKEIGVTVHFASEEIDRGDLVLQSKFPVSSLDNEESLYEKALWFGTFLMVKALKQLEGGTLQKMSQDLEKASYFSWPASHERSVLKRRQKREGRERSFLAEKPRVMHFITRMIRGGAQENTLGTIRGLQKLGYEVTLVTGPSWGSEGELISEAIQEGLDVVILPELVREISPWKDFVCVLKLLSWLRRSNYLILHTHTSKAGFLGRLAAHSSRIPIGIHTPHGHVFHSYFSWWKEKLFLTMERKGANWCQRLIALTEAERREHLELGVGKPDQWVVIPSGVDEKCFQAVSAVREEEIRKELGIPLDRKIVGFIGRFTPIKGLHYLIEAMPHIIQTMPNCHFLLVGDGEERQSYERRVLELGLNPNVTFAGHQRNVSEFASLMDILVVPSLNEGMGRVIVEGGLLRKAVIGTQVGGILDLIKENETGVLVAPRDSDQIASSVIRLLQDPAFSNQLGERLRREVFDDFTEDLMVKKIHCLYQELLAEKGLRDDKFLCLPVDQNCVNISQHNSNN